MRLEWNKRLDNYSYDTEEGLWAWESGKFFSIRITKRNRGFHRWKTKYDGVPYRNIAIGRLSLFFGDYAEARFIECDYWVWNNGELDKEKSKWKE
jgi:hypothetical protein